MKTSRYLITARAAVAVEPTFSLKPATRSTAKKRLPAPVVTAPAAAGPTCLTLWADKAQATAAGKLLAVRLHANGRTEVALSGVGAGTISWVLADSVLTPAQVQHWRANARFSVR